MRPLKILERRLVRPFGVLCCLIVILTSLEIAGNFNITSSVQYLRKPFKRLANVIPRGLTNSIISGNTRKTTYRTTSYKEDETVRGVSEMGSTWGDERTYNEQSEFNCSNNSRHTHVEDLLCMERYNFLQNFKNPCWFEQRNRTQIFRCFPYFHIFGVCKAGTTDLFHRLIKHPQIIGNKGIFKKEVNFWAARRYGKQYFRYRDIFNTTFPVPSALNLTDFIDYFDADQIFANMMVSNKDGAHYSDTITGQADPLEFWDQTQWKWIPQNNILEDEPQYTVPHLIKHFIPNIKLILLLRDPVERLYSHFFHGGFGRNNTMFHFQVQNAIRILKECQYRHSLRSCLYNQTIMNRLPAPIYASFYHIHLKEWLKAFPRDQMFIFRTEDYAKNIRHYMLKLFAFLGVRDVSFDQLRAICKNVHEFKTTKKLRAGPMRNDTRQLLREYFKKPNEELAKLLGDDKYLWNDIHGTH